MYTYQTLLEQEQALSFQEADSLHQQLLPDENDPKENELYQEVLQAGKEYIAIRINWAFQTKEEKKSINDIRTQKHNAVINSLDALAQYQKEKGKDTSWRDQLGYEENGKYFRKRIGDMGCYLAYLISISTR